MTRSNVGPTRAVTLPGWRPWLAPLLTSVLGLLALAGADTRALARHGGKACDARPGTLGIARIVEIDTTRGPRFGQLHYPENDFLREGEVVLTFDDGPQRKSTRMVLDALAAHCTRATFFMVGQMALTDPEMVREVAGAGHTIALHTWSHRNLRAIGPDKARDELELGLSAVQRALGRPVAPFFRFPYLADSPAMLEHLSQRNLAVFSIDVDSKDFRTRDPGQMRKTLMGGLAQRNKGILLLHDIQQSTALGIRALLDELAARGFKVVHLVPKTTMPTQPSYDAMADAELARRSKMVASSPTAARAVVWPLTPPGAVVEHYKPGGAPAPGARGQALPPTGRPSPTATPVAAPQRPAAGGPVAPPPTAAPPPQPAPDAAAAPEPQPEMRGTRDDDDWRKRVFQH